MAFRPIALFAAILVASLLPFAPVSAEPADFTAGASLNFLTGKHDTGTAAQHLTLVPVPIGEFELRASPIGFRIEGFPPLTGSANDSTTRLSIVNGTLRAYAPGRLLFAGFGQTIYNQMTVDGPRSIDPNRTHASRVTGLRFEAGASGSFAANDRLEFVVAYNPKMHGVIFTSQNGLSGTDPESATQIDVALRRIIRHGRSEFVYGIRYLNFTARYETIGRTYDGALADRNVGALPVIGWRWRI